MRRLSRIYNSVMRQQTPSRPASNIRSRSRPRESIHPEPPAFPRPKLAFNRRRIQKVNRNIEHNLMINLEDLIMLENMLSVTTHSSPEEGLLACEGYWEITEENTLNNIPDLFTNQKVKSSMKKSLVIGNLVVSVAHFLLTQGDTALDIIRPLMFNYHQAYLQFVKFALDRVSVNNKWTEELKSILADKNAKSQWMYTPLSLFKSYLKACVNLLKKLGTALYRYPDKNSRELRNIINHILKEIETITVKQARNKIENSCGVYRQEPVVKRMPSIPFIRSPSRRDFTLVLDLDETLIHYFEYDNTYAYHVRPHTKEFLSDISKHYEIIVFTAGVQSYADWVLDDVDKERKISHRLYRQHSVHAGAFFVKDLSLIGRDLSKTIIVDNVPENFQFQPENGIAIKSWFGDMADNALLELSEVLLNFTQLQIHDIRVVLKQCRDQQVNNQITRHNNDEKSGQI